jgi:hypothetical protein
MPDISNSRSAATVLPIPADPPKHQPAPPPPAQVSLSTRNPVVLGLLLLASYATLGARVIRT